MNTPILTKEMAHELIFENQLMRADPTDKELALDAIAQERANVVSLDPEDERREFEEWALEECFELTRHPKNSRAYSDGDTQAVWHAWQASRRVGVTK